MSTFDVVAAPHPLKVETKRYELPVGLTLEQMFDVVQPDPILMRHAIVFVGGDLVPREYWHLVRPKVGADVTVRVVPAGGGGNKNLLRTLLQIAVIAASIAFGPEIAAIGLGVEVAAVTAVEAAVASALINLAGNLLINVIAPIRPAPTGGDQPPSPTFAIENARNTARTFQPVPVVLGRHRQVAPLGSQTFTEIVGDDQYLRVLVVWGYGRLKIEDVRIGETSIDEFEDVEIEHREGQPGDAPFTLFPSTVDQDAFSITLFQADGFSQRTSGPDADELSVDFLFPKGLVVVNGEGETLIRPITMEIQFRKVGDVDWLTPTFTATTISPDNISGSEVTIVGRREEAVRYGFRWSTPERAQYEVRGRRLSDDLGLFFRNAFDESAWVTLRAITNEDPLNFSHPVAATALVIRATDQLNSTVDELNAIVSSYALDWNGAAWVEQTTSNPASLYRHVLQGNANARALTDSRIDLDGLQKWHDTCAANGFEFNMIRDFSASVWDTLADIASVGRASPSQVDGKWSVVCDVLQTVPTQHFTPRNSNSFRVERGFPDMPHALRVRFNNRNEDWRQDERIVYDDGYDESNATDFASLDAPGIDDPDHIWKFARFAIAQGRLRPERWTFNVDFEHLVARRGDMVLITHDVLLVGIKSGRIKSLIFDGSNNVTGLVSDEELPMEEGKSYGLSFRAVGDHEITRQVVTTVGEHNTTVTLSTPITEAEVMSSQLLAGDLFGFGELGSETIEGLVIAVEPDSDLAAKLSVVPYSPAVYSADTGTIPAYDSGLTPLATTPSLVVTGIRSDESALERGAGNTLLVRIAVQRPGVIFAAQIRASGTDESFLPVKVVGLSDSEVLIGDVQEGQTYDLRLRWNDPTKLIPGAWTPINNHTVVGQTTPPGGLTDLTISVAGGQAILRWGAPEELDVKFGGVVRFRHSSELDASSASWQSSTSISRTARAEDLIVALPLKPGTYLARVFDRGGRQSTDVAKISTKQASVLAFTTLGTAVEHSAFSGVKSGTVAIDGKLQLASVGLIDDQPDFDAISTFDALGGLATSGTYTFAAGLDLGSVTRTRLTSNIVAQSINLLDMIDDRTDLIDTWQDFDGNDQAVGDVIVEVRHTDDDPGGSPTWSDWNTLDSAEFEARGFQFRAHLMTEDPAFNIQVSELSVTAEETT